MIATIFFVFVSTHFSSEIYAFTSSPRTVHHYYDLSHRHELLPRLPYPTSRHYSNKSFINLLFSSSRSNSQKSAPRKRRYNSLTLPAGVGAFYSGVGLVLVHLIREEAITGIEASVGCSFLWLGFVLAISFMEAWVKFRAPFLPRHYGLDVGRTIFPVLNAVEVAFCGTLWVIQLLMKGAIVNRLLMSITLILLSQVIYLTPQLVLTGKHVICEAFPIPEVTWSAKQVQVYSDLCNEVSNKPRPPLKLHLIYLLQEFAKVILLGRFIWNCHNAVL